MAVELMNAGADVDDEHNGELRAMHCEKSAVSWHFEGGQEFAS